MNEQNSSGLFQRQWKQKEGVIIAAGLWTIGLLLELFQLSPSVPPFPANLLLLILLSGIILILHFQYKQSELVRWHSSATGAIFSTGLFSIQILILAVVPQQSGDAGSSPFGFDHMVSGWPFAIALMWLLVCLGLTIAKRWPATYSLRNIAFLLNHLGIWIILSAMAIGSGDVREMQFTAVKGHTLNRSGNGDPRAVLPFQVTLLDFNIQYYPPKIALYDPYCGEFPVKHKSLPFARENQALKVKDWNITPLNILTNSIPGDTGFIASPVPGGGTAIYVSAQRKNSGKAIEGWIFSGTKDLNPQDLPLEGQAGLAVFEPEPLKYISSLHLEGENNLSETVEIEVNKPASFQGWKLYQSGYDTSAGENSGISILFAIRDPWLPVIYLGIMMLFAGGILMILIGNSRIYNTSKPTA
ncbi:MAG: hypothetical protein PHS48_07975 [Bacteroidales bacterium]|nr:hypothetical protein [Bacteroidales bacterium]